MAGARDLEQVQVAGHRAAVTVHVLKLSQSSLADEGSDFAQAACRVTSAELQAAMAGHGS